MIEFEKSFNFSSNLSYKPFQRPLETLDEALKRSKKELREIRRKNLKVRKTERIEREKNKKIRRKQRTQTP